mmetsp:Transcript_128107/g.410666  ORF Transcript_128107/g.410666 Transcript_128107/m.410666 type:complete len:120 (+) Transcript_128107:36-395(+)
MRSTWRPPGTAGGDEKKGDTRSESAQAGIATQNSPAGGGEVWQKTLCSHLLLVRACARAAQSEEEDEECLLKVRRTWIWKSTHEAERGLVRSAAPPEGGDDVHTRTHQNLPRGDRHMER